MRIPLPHFLAILTLCCALISQSATAGLVFEIGTPDNNDSEFALAPKGFERFANDGFYVPGASDPKADWPYVQPGPVDRWAGSRQHTFIVAFGLKTAAKEGTCHFNIDFLDTHKSQPPRLRVVVNGQSFERRLPPGAGDASVHGDVEKGREFVWDLEFPSSLLRTGENEIRITSMSGSWVLYDALWLEAPGGTELMALPESTEIIQAEAPPVWLREGDKAVQPVRLAVRHFGQETRGQVRVRGATTSQKLDLQGGEFELKNGLQTIEAKVPAEEGSRQLEVVLMADGKQLASTNIHVAPPRIREMWLLPHSHVDIGYTHRQDEIVQVQIANLRTAMKLARETAGNPPGMRFKWNPEAVWSLDHFLKQAGAEEKQEFIAAVKRGDVGVDALYGNLLTGLCRPEELVQGLAFGARLSNLTGVPVRSASICDVPGWTWGIVPIMADAGVKYFAIGPNFRDRVGRIHVWDNKPFYWRSQSGKERILCWVVDNYHFFGDLEPHVLAQVSELEREDFPYDTSFMFWVGRSPNGAVDNAPPDEKTAEKVMAWNAKYVAPRVTIGLAGEYFRAFEARYGAQVPEFGGDLTPYWEDGAGSTSKETSLNRRSADRLSQAETLAVMRRKSEPAAAWDAAWKNVLLYSEHTWGAWCSISAPDDPFTKDQWRVKQGFALGADRQSRELLAAALSTEVASEAPKEIDVINTTQYERTGLAIVSSRFGGNSVRDAGGRAVPTQRLASGDLCFVAKKVPPFGARRYRLTARSEPARGSAAAEGSSIRNAQVSVEVDPSTGAIRSLRLANSREEFVDDKAPVAINDFRYVLGTNAAGALKNGPVKITVIEPGPVVARLRIESDAPGCNQLTREISVIDGLDRIELVNSLDRKTVREKDAVHFGYGFNVPGGQIRMETPWAVVRPDADQLAGACRNWFTVQRWVDISNDKMGMTWSSLDAPLMEIGGMTANLLGVVDFNEWLTNALDSQTIYSWAQNNHWHTNYKIDQPGVTTFEYVLQAHMGGYSAGQAAQLGMETTRPLIVAPAEGKAPAPSLLRIDSRDVLVESVKSTSDGKGVIVRLFGVGGKDQSVRIRWDPDRKPDSLWLTDLTEKPLRKVEGEIKVAAYGVVHLRAEYR